MESTGHLVSYESNAGAGAFVEFNTGDAKTANVNNTTGINPGEDDPTSNTITAQPNLYTKARNIPGDSWDAEAMTYDPSTGGTSYVFMVANMATAPTYLNTTTAAVPADNAANFPTTNILYVLNANGTPVQGLNVYNNAATAGPRAWSDIVPLGSLNKDESGNPVAKITGMSTIGSTVYVSTIDGKIYALGQRQSFRLAESTGTGNTRPRTT